MTIESSRQVLILGATGTVGGEVARAAVAKGARVRALVRSDAAAAKLPAGVETVRGDLRDEPSLVRALRGVSAVFYVSPHEADEEALAERIVRVCAAAGVRLVFVGVHVDGGTRLARAFKRFVFARMISHYAPKFRLSEMVRQKSPNAVILIPTNYFQNDELFTDEIIGGKYRIAFGKPVNRVDVRDLGEAAALALVDDSLPGGAYPVVGPLSLTGAECAAIWSEVLGRPVEYDRDEAGFRAALARVVSGKKYDDFVASFGILRGFALPTLERELAATKALLGRPPTSYRSYVRDLVATRRTSRAA